MLQKMLEPFANDKATSDELNRRFGSKTITTTDAFNVITQDECIRRFKAMGDYDSFTLPSGRTINVVSLRLIIDLILILCFRIKIRIVPLLYSNVCTKVLVMKLFMIG